MERSWRTIDFNQSNFSLLKREVVQMVVGRVYGNDMKFALVSYSIVPISYQYRLKEKVVQWVAARLGRA